jgi:hypothetical protein
MKNNYSFKAKLFVSIAFIAITGVAFPTFALADTLWQLQGSSNISNVNTGNVGVGTDSPGSKLEVGGALTVGYQQGIMSRYSTGGIAPVLQVGTGTMGVMNGIPNTNLIAPQLNGWQLGTAITGISGRQDTPTGSGLSFLANRLEVMRIAYTGNVGIGTLSPTQKLDVSGNIKLSGSIVSDGDICIGKCD